VNDDNTVILYPGMFGYQYPYDPVSMYLAEGVPVTEPHKIRSKPASCSCSTPRRCTGRTSTSRDDTRIVITTRLNPGQPRFDLNAVWNFEQLVLLGRSREAQVLLGDRLPGEGQPRQAVVRVQAGQARAGDARHRARVARSRAVSRFRVCASSEIPEGGKVAVNAGDEKLMVFRIDGKVKAVSRICPHLNFDMYAAYSDESKLYCPGHGRRILHRGRQLALQGVLARGLRGIGARRVRVPPAERGASVLDARPLRRREQSMRSVTLLDTATASTNLGDQIIMEAVRREIDEVCADAFQYSVVSHEWMGRRSRSLIGRGRTSRSSAGRTCSARGCGSSRSGRSRPCRPSGRARSSSWAAAGYQDQYAADLYSRWLFKRVLEQESIFTRCATARRSAMLKGAGVPNVINTGLSDAVAPDPDRCAAIPHAKSSSVVTTLNTYITNPAADRELLQLLRGEL
jgi:nitrite reductase/ring-hydroxylating ferredoxin subunit